MPIDRAIVQVLSMATWHGKLSYTRNNDQDSGYDNKDVIIEPWQL